MLVARRSPQTPHRLPRGSHGIPADVVAENQRERIIAAMAEVCARVGYADLRVVDVVKQAGVSSVTFYKRFADKRDCMLATHGQLSERLLEHTRQLPDLLGLLAMDPPAARLLTVEILAVGPEGAERHDALVAALAELLDWDWIRTAGALALVGKYVMAGEAKRLPTLEGELS